MTLSDSHQQELKKIEKEKEKLLERHEKIKAGLSIYAHDGNKDKSNTEQLFCSVHLVYCCSSILHIHHIYIYIYIYSNCVIQKNIPNSLLFFVHQDLRKDLLDKQRELSKVFSDLEKLQPFKVIYYHIYIINITTRYCIHCKVTQLKYGRIYKHCRSQ